MIFIRRDLFNEDEGTFKCLYIETPRSAGFEWVQPRRGKKRRWLERSDETAEAYQCTWCKRFATVRILSSVGRGRERVYGMACAECRLAHDQQREMARAQKAIAYKPIEPPPPMLSRQISIKLPVDAIANKHQCAGKNSTCWYDGRIEDSDGRRWCGQHAPNNLRLAANAAKTKRKPRGPVPQLLKIEAPSLQPELNVMPPIPMVPWIRKDGVCVLHQQKGQEYMRCEAGLKCRCGRRAWYVPA